MLDPAAVTVLEALNVGPNLFELDPAAARAALAALPAVGAAPEVAQVVELEVPGPAGPLPARLVRPLGTGTGTDGDGDGDGAAPPVLLWLHGGGWTFGSIDRSDATIRSVAAATGALTLAIDYRLAPEDPFPAAVHDAWAALGWLADHAGRYGGDGTRLAVAGDSAGGNLAAVTALMARDAGTPALRAQGIVYAPLDFDFATPSYRANATGCYLTRRAMRAFADHYVPDPAARSDWRAAPLRAPSHRGVAPAVIVTAEHDPLRDDGARYADALVAAEVPVTHRCFPGMIHGFFSMTAALTAGREAQAFLGTEMRALLAPTTATDKGE